MVWLHLEWRDPFSLNCTRSGRGRSVQAKMWPAFFSIELAGKRALRDSNILAVTLNQDPAPSGTPQHQIQFCWNISERCDRRSRVGHRYFCRMDLPTELLTGTSECIVHFRHQLTRRQAIADIYKKRKLQQNTTSEISRSNRQAQVSLVESVLSLSAMQDTRRPLILSAWLTKIEVNDFVLPYLMTLRHG